MKDVILAVAHDIGDANALKLVVEALQREDRVDVTVLCEADSACAFAGTPRCTCLADFGARCATPDAVSRVMDQVRPRLVMTGRSYDRSPLNRLCVVEAARRGIPSLVVVDHWTNLRETFLNDHGEVDYVPDLVAVMDETARKGLLDAGIDAARICVTGQPSFDAVRAFASRTGNQDRLRFRDQLGVPPDSLLVVFASEDVEASERRLGLDPVQNLGYSEKTVLRELLHLLQAVVTENGLRLHFVVKAHPRENPEDLGRVLQNAGSLAFACNLLQQARAWELILAADVVVGMTSMFLLEAAILQRPVLSLQIGRKTPDTFIGTLRGATLAAYTTADAQALLRQLLTSASYRQEVLQRQAAFSVLPNATDGVKSLVYRLLSRRATQVGKGALQ